MASRRVVLDGDTAGLAPQRGAPQQVV